MGNPAGQRPDGFHLLSLLKLGFQFVLFFFRFFSFGDVAQNPPVTHGLSVLIFQQRNRQLKGNVAAVLADDIIVGHIFRFSGFSKPLGDAVHFGGSIRRGVFADICPQQFVAGITQYF